MVKTVEKGEIIPAPLTSDKDVDEDLDDDSDDHDLIYDSKEREMGYYTDWIYVAWTQYTFSFEFAQAMVRDDPRAIIRLLMSPERVKAFSIELSERIKAYEKECGEIRMSNPNEE
jgi:hypothetical protein